jgi:hypothetical protein
MCRKKAAPLSLCLFIVIRYGGDVKPFRQIFLKKIAIFLSAKKDEKFIPFWHIFLKKGVDKAGAGVYNKRYDTKFTESSRRP